MDRRAYLGLVGAAVASVAGCTTQDPTNTQTPSTPPSSTPTTPATPTPSINEFERIDVVEDLGCDPTGGEPCVSKLQNGLANGVALEFPAGTYRFEDRLDISGYSRIALIGDGSVKLVPPKGFNTVLVDVGQTNQFLLRGIDIDITASNTTAGVRVICRDSFTIDDVEFIGRGTHSDRRVVHAMLVGLTKESGRGLIRNVRAIKGSAIGHYKNGDGRAGISIGPWNFGTIRIQDCHLEEFGNNGIYASRTSGNVEVVGGLYRNNNVASIRISGNGSYVTGATIEVDLGSYTGPLTQLDSQFNTRGIAIEQGPADKPPGVEIRDCTIVIEETPRSKGGIYIFPTGRTTTVRNTKIEVNADDVPAVYRSVLEPQGQYEPAEAPHWVKLENVEITGRARGAAGVILYDAPDSVIRNCTIDQTGADRDGVYLTNSLSTVIDGGSVKTTRYPYVVGVDSENGTDACLLKFGSVPEVQSPRSGGPFRSGNTVSIEDNEFRVDGGGVLGSDECLSVDDFVPTVDGDNTLAITGTSEGQLEWLRFVAQ
ncbi:MULTISPECIES: hypothetical protein [Haloferax]|uniref:Right handed beta helix domain-containing protein n=2 Tax=Haloferax TaxID=2251 RepID=A0A6G1Z7G4_9EURY|nr:MULTISPECIES: hypothetical protein [Haloferax]KAB1185163.1 hypothetical protein Hfx1149_16735 [Haloferax sp. CBA1149]MRW82341.1 hypothetical protein [Haloferax marinisediminis]